MMSSNEMTLLDEAEAPSRLGVGNATDPGIGKVMGR